jgi:hypothetical protein
LTKKENKFLISIIFLNNIGVAFPRKQVTTSNSKWRISMKRPIFKFLQISIFLSAIGIFISAFSHEKSTNHQEMKIEKIYIDPSKIYFDQKQMYIYLNQDWVGTNAIYSDSEGVYIIETQGGWTCGYCGNYNEDNGWTCNVCNRKRD